MRLATGSICGAILGASLGLDAIPAEGRTVVG